MTRLLSATKWALCLIAVLTAGQAASAPACTVLTAQDAAAVLGVALPENFKTDSPPTPQNGHDATSACGWFPKGYSLATASAPPDKGILVTVHGFRTPAEAANFHKMAVEMAQEIARKASPNAKLSLLEGLGESAFVDQKQFAGVNIAMARFVKASSAVQIQVWSKGASASSAATTAAKQVAAKL